MISYDKLYKVDSKGKLRFYYIEQNEDQYRMVTGIDEGKEIRTKWTTAKPKNVGKINATTGKSQAHAEIVARYNKKSNEGYFANSEKAKANPLGGFFSPMLATEVDKVIAKYKIWPQLADPKLDGMRMTCKKNDAISRKGKKILTVDHIMKELEDFFEEFPSVRLDGELYNHEYKEDFNTLMSIARQTKPTDEDLKLACKKLQFHVYDCYHYDAPQLPAEVRKGWLERNLPTFNMIELVSYKIVNNQEELDVIKEQNLIDGYEGTITRGYDSVYENKRSRWLLKHKDFITEEFKVVDILAGKGNRSGIAGTVQISKWYASNPEEKDLSEKIVGCGIKGSYEYAEKLLKKKDNYIGKLATVRHFGETPDGSLRFPVCIDIDRPDA